MAAKKNGAKRNVPRKCPTCRTVADAVGGLRSDEPPKIGSVVVCNHCGMLEIIRESGQLSKMTAAEWGALDDDDRVHLLNVEDGRRRVMGG